MKEKDSTGMSRKPGPWGDEASLSLRSLSRDHPDQSSLTSLPERPGALPAPQKEAADIQVVKLFLENVLGLFPFFSLHFQEDLIASGSLLRFPLCGAKSGLGVTWQCPDCLALAPGQFHPLKPWTEAAGLDPVLMLSGQLSLGPPRREGGREGLREEGKILTIRPISVAVATFRND